MEEVQKRKKVTIYDVAEMAQVTIATVSRVINGKDNVALKTKQKVMTAIEDLNYYPSPIASGLSGAKSQEIGILVPFFFGEFFLQILEGITHEMSEHDIILYNADTPQKKKELIARISGENKLDGLFIISLPILMDEEIQLKKANFPVVLVDNKHPDYRHVSFDNVFGTYHAVEHLIENGHTKIALFTGAAEDPFHLTVAKDRTKGFRMAMNMHDLPIPEDYIRINDWTRLGAKELAKDMLNSSNPPTAIIAISDAQAVGIIDAAKELGVRVPQDLSVVGYDNLEFSDYMGMTTISQPLGVAAQIAADMMNRALDGDLKKEAISLQPTLIQRNTVCTCPCE